MSDLGKKSTVEWIKSAGPYLDTASRAFNRWRIRWMVPRVLILLFPVLFFTIEIIVTGGSPLVGKMIYVATDSVLSAAERQRADQLTNIYYYSDIRRLDRQLYRNKGISYPEVKRIYGHPEKALNIFNEAHAQGIDLPSKSARELAKGARNRAEGEVREFFFDIREDQSALLKVFYNTPLAERRANELYPAYRESYFEGFDFPDYSKWQTWKAGWNQFWKWYIWMLIPSLWIWYSLIVIMIALTGLAFIFNIKRLWLGYFLGLALYFGYRLIMIGIGHHEIAKLMTSHNTGSQLFLHIWYPFFTSLLFMAFGRKACDWALWLNQRRKIVLPYMISLMAWSISYWWIKHPSSSGSVYMTFLMFLAPFVFAFLSVRFWNGFFLLRNSKTTEWFTFIDKVCLLVLIGLYLMLLRDPVVTSYYLDAMHSYSPISYIFMLILISFLGMILLPYLFYSLANKHKAVQNYYRKCWVVMIIVWVVILIVH